MTSNQLSELIRDTELYNLHSHTHYCDGRNTLHEMVSAAASQGFRIWGVSPHAPICVDSPCNMSLDSVERYIAECSSLKEYYSGRMRLLAGMEVDYISADFGPHIDYFNRLPLDYRIGSVHFVPSQEGVPLDCDGSAERFARYLKEGFHDDLRYVVEKFFEQELMMLERGGFEVLGHFDKIAGNATAIDPDLESYGWYRALIEDVIDHAAANGGIVEINTKALEERHRFYPAESVWSRLLKAGVPIAVNSDAHRTDRLNAGRPEALKILASLSETVWTPVYGGNRNIAE